MDLIKLIYIKIIKKGIIMYYIILEDQIQVIII